MEQTIGLLNSIMATNAQSAHKTCYNVDNMIVEIPDQVLEQTGLSSTELLLKVALLLFKEEKLTLGQASRLAGLHQYEFQKELVRAGIPIHYGEEDLERDIQTLGLKK